MQTTHSHKPDKILRTRWEHITAAGADAPARATAPSRVHGVAKRAGRPRTVHRSTPTAGTTITSTMGATPPHSTAVPAAAAARLPGAAAAPAVLAATPAPDPRATPVPTPMIDAIAFLDAAALAQQSDPVTAAHIDTENSLRRPGISIITDFNKKDAVKNAQGSVWDNDIRAWVVNDVQIVRNAKNHVIFQDGLNLGGKCAPTVISAAALSTTTASSPLKPTAPA